MPVVVAMVVVVLLTGAGLSAQLRLESAARGAARELARGEDTAAAVAAAQRIGGDGTLVSTSADGAWVRVETTRTLRAPAGLLGGASWTLAADAEARREPHLTTRAAQTPARPGTAPPGTIATSTGGAR